MCRGKGKVLNGHCSDRHRNQMASATFKGRVKDKLYKWKPGMDHGSVSFSILKWFSIIAIAIYSAYFRSLNEVTLKLNLNQSDALMSHLDFFLTVLPFFPSEFKYSTRVVCTYLISSIAIYEVRGIENHQTQLLIRGKTRQEVIQLKSRILLKLGTHVGFGKKMIMAKE